MARTESMDSVGRTKLSSALIATSEDDIQVVPGLERAGIVRTQPNIYLGT